MGDKIFDYLIENMDLLDFEARKDVAFVITNMLRREYGQKMHTAQYFETHPHLLVSLVRGMENPDVSFNCGAILRQCIRQEALAAVLLKDDLLKPFYRFVDAQNFDLQSDAFNILRDLLTVHKDLVADYLETNFDDFFAEPDPATNVLSYKSLLQSDNYFARRQSLKLLGELLLDRKNHPIMTRFITDPQNLKLMMIRLRDDSKSIQLEAFHVFKIFVANPYKADPIVEILSRNKGKLLEYLDNFNPEKDDEQFQQEKQLLISTIEAL